MSPQSRVEKTQAKAAIAALFNNSPPVLVEVRFPNSGTAPDWHLCETQDEFEQIIERLGAGAEIFLSSVWDLKNGRGAVGLIK